MAVKAPVPKFGSWDAENIGYTVFFEKVRESKPPPPASSSRDADFDPYEHYGNLSRNAPSRPESSHGHGPAPPHRLPQRGGTGYHRRNGSNGSSPGSEVSRHGSKFSPPGPYQLRYGNNCYPPQQGGGGGAYAAPVANSYPTQQGGGCGYSAREYPSPSPKQHHHQHAAPRVAASPPVGDRATTKASAAVPKFGVWDEQNATAAAQGFTVQFEKVKRHREVVAKSPPPDVRPPQQLFSPEQPAPPPPAFQRRPRRTKPKKSFVSKMYECLFPRVREGL